MDFLDRASSGAINRRSATAGESVMGSSWFPSLFGVSAKGAKPVGYKKALTLSAVYNAVDIKSDSLGVIPFQVFKKTEEGRERLATHPVDWLLNGEPDGENGWLIPFHFKKLIGTSILLRGNCLFIKKVNGAGEVRLKYVPWDDVTDIRKVKQENGESYLVYLVKNQPYLSSEVLHYKGMSLDGIVGLSVITYAALNLGLAIEVQQFSYTNFDSKGVRQGVIETDNVLKEGAKTAVKSGWREAMQEKNADRVVVLDEGMKFTPIMITPQEAQIIEQARFSIEDIARFFNVPLYKLKSLTQSTNNNVEQMAIDYVVDCMLPMVTSVEQETAKKLLTMQERRKQLVYVRGNMDILLRADQKTRSEALTRYVNGGIMTPNEARAKEELNTKNGGDELRFPVNTQTQDEIDAKLNPENNGSN